MSKDRGIAVGLSSTTAIVLLLLPALISAQQIPYATLQPITAQDSQDAIVAKAAHVLPRPNQTDWMRLEQTYFIHYGPNAFRGVEWGNGREDPSIFNPAALDADQWMRTVRDGGGKLVILVCKHHDGFNLWPTRYSTHSVAASPWESGRGNLVRDVAVAARKYNIKLGVYLSPADLYQLRTNPTNPAGYYGNGSPTTDSVIPTDPASFQKDPARARKPAAGFGSFHYKVDDYNRYFLNELYELLTEYGRVDEVWFDGANPDPSVHETYDYNAWYDMIYRLQPHAIIFGKGPDGRWVGNESGIGRTTEWSVVPLSAPPDKFRWPDMTDQDLGSIAKLKPGSFLWWYPAETNVPLLHGWFWAEDKTSRTAAEILDVYYQSVGRNSNMLLNLSPDTRGRIPDLQVANVRQMNGILRETFATNLASGAQIEADSSQQDHPANAATDSNLDTWWQAASGKSTATVTLKLPRPAIFDVISLQEAVDRRSQRIESFAVDVYVNGDWKQVDRQTTIGHKRLLRLLSPVSTDRVRIRITGSRLEPTLAEIGLFKQASFTPAPVIAERDRNGAVSIASTDRLRTVYTLDSSIPTLQSKTYTGPIPMADGGRISAASIGADGRLGMLAVRDTPGIFPAGWRVVGPVQETNGHPATNAIDGDSATFWQTPPNPQSGHQIVIDMGKVRRIAGLSYLPRRDGQSDGVVVDFRFQTSLDGKQWKTVVDKGSFDNIANNPEAQKVRFAETEARFFRLVAIRTLGTSNTVSAAEISVIAAP